MMMKKILIPDLGDIGEVDVIEIPIEVGDHLQKEDTMVVLESEKATMEVPVPEAGIVKQILLKVGDKIGEGDAALMLEVSLAEGTEDKQAALDESSKSIVDEVAVVMEAEPEKTAQEQASEAVEQPLVIPDIGDLEDIEVIEIQVIQGDRVEKEQTLLVLESEKASMEVPSSVAGEIVSLSVKLGDKVNTGTVIGTIKAFLPAIKKPVEEKVIETAEVKTESVVSAPASRPPVSDQPALQTAVKKGLVHASPGVRRYARELGADLTKVKGTGAKSRVLKTDVTQFIKDELARPRATANSSASFMPEVPVIDHGKFGEIEQVPLSRIQKISSVNLHRNWVSIPHVTQFDEADITELEVFRKSLKDEAAQAGVKVTPLIFMLKAVASTLQAFPTFNASLAADGENLVLKKYVHIGVAVDTPNGLVVPVVRDVDQKSLYELAQELGELSQKAREGKLSPAAMQGSCFTISSLGGIGGTAFTPIVNWPDVAILGVSRSQMKPIWDGKEFQPKMMLPLSLSYDHRVIDGAVAARFTTHLSKILSDIRRILL